MNLFFFWIIFYCVRDCIVKCWRQNIWRTWQFNLCNNTTNLICCVLLFTPTLLLSDNIFGITQYTSMHSLTCTPLSSHHTTLNPLLGADATSRPFSHSLPFKRRTCFTTRAVLSSTREDVLKHFNERRALKVRN